MRRQRRAAVGVFTIAAPHLLDEQSANHDLFGKCNGTFNWLLFSWICQNIFGGGNFLSVFKLATKWEQISNMGCQKN